MSYWSRLRANMPGRGLLPEDRPAGRGTPNPTRKKRERRLKSGLSAYLPSGPLRKYREDMAQLEALGQFGTSADDAAKAARDLIESVRRERAEANEKSQGHIGLSRPTWNRSSANIPSEPRRPERTGAGELGNRTGVPKHHPPSQPPRSSR